MSELLSARADGETTAHENALLSDHLAHCADCSALADRVEALDRQVRFRPAEPVPDMVASITSRARPATLGRGGWLRPAIAWVAVVLLAQNTAVLLSGRLAGAESHQARHIGAFGVALAVGFAYVAWKPHRSSGLLPFAAALITTMSISAVAAVVDGGRTLLAESAHVTEIVGLVLLWMIAGSPGWSRITRRRHHRTPLSS